MSTDNFSLYSAVCPTCQKESFLDPEAKQKHIRAAGGNSPGIEKMPIVYGELGVVLPPTKLAYIIEQIFNKLHRNADIVIKYSPYDIRMDKNNLSSKDIDTLHKTRGSKRVAIYTIRSLIRDISAGADIKKRLISFITG